MNLKQGFIVGSCTLEEKLGEGGFGVVYKALTNTDEPVALKFPKPDFEDFIFQEAKIHTELKHPNIRKIREINYSVPPYLVMEYIEKTLRDKIGETSVGESIEIIKQIASALDYAHLNKIVHGDIKPENILIDSDLYVKVCDFGLAKPLADSFESTLKQTLVSRTKKADAITMQYASPEQLDGKEALEQSDIFSLNKVFYELLTGKPLGVGVGPGPQGIHNALKKAKVDEDLIQLIKKGLDYEAGRRYQTIDEFVSALKKNKHRNDPAWDEIIKLGDEVDEFVSDLKKIKTETIKPDDKAIELVNEADAYVNKGIALAELDKLEDAINLFDKAIELDPTFADAYVNKGAVLGELGELEEAIESYDKAIELKPDIAEAYFGKGAVLQKLGELGDAIKSFDKAIELNPKYDKIYFYKASILVQLGVPEDAIKLFNKAIKLEPNSAENYIAKGNVLVGLGKFKKAIKSFDKAIKLKSEDFDYLAYFYKGTALTKLSKFKKAIKSYDKAIKLKPNYIEAYEEKRKALLLKRQQQELTEFLRKLRK